MITIRCVKHGSIVNPFESIRCSQCIEDAIEERKKLLSSLDTNIVNVTTSFANVGEQEFFVGDDKTKRNLFHRGTYLEWDIPEELEKELNDYVGKRISEFEKTCMCVDCQRQRSLKDEKRDS